MSEPYAVYGMELSYFTRKMEAAMQWYGLPFERRSKDMQIQSELESRAGTNQIPVLRTPDNWMIADTTPLMDLMDARVPKRRMFPIGPLGVLVHVVEEWFDEWVPRTCIHYRWNYDESAAFAAANLAAEVQPDGDEALRSGIGQMIAGWGKKACRATGMSEPAQQEAGEAEYLRVLQALDAQLALTKYSLGDRPCAVDAVLVGGLRAHFAADPVPSRVVAQFANVMRWMEVASTWDGHGSLAAFPQSTPFARFVLGEMGGAYRAFVLANAEAVAAGAKAFTATVHGDDVSYRARPYPERSRQMIRDRIALRLDATERATVLSWLEQVGLSACFAP